MRRKRNSTLMRLGSLMAGASILAFITVTPAAEAIPGLGAIVDKILAGIAKLQEKGLEVQDGQLGDLSDELNVGIDDLQDALGTGQVEQTETLAINQERDMNLQVKIKDAEFRREVELENEKTYKEAAANYYATAAACREITNRLVSQIIEDRNNEARTTIGDRLDQYGSGRSTETSKSGSKIAEANRLRYEYFRNKEGPLQDAPLQSGFFLGNKKYDEVSDAELDQARAEAIAVALGPVPQRPDDEDAEGAADYARSALQHSAASNALLEVSLDNTQSGGNSPMRLLEKALRDNSSDKYLESLEGLPMRELLEELVRHQVRANEIDFKTLRYVQRLIVLEANKAGEELDDRRKQQAKRAQLNRTSAIEDGTGAADEQ